jgi:hypothetical protein
VVISCCGGRFAQPDGVREKPDFARQFKPQSSVQSLAQKYLSSVFQKFVVFSCYPASMEEGRTRDRHEDVRRGCDGRLGDARDLFVRTTALRRTTKSYGPDTPTLVSSREG